MRTDKWHEDLRCALHPAEVAERADRCAIKMGERDKVAIELKVVSAELRTQIKALEGEISSLGRMVREKVETREVECKEVEAFGQNAVQVVRLDTGEVVRERAMTSDEQQRALFPRAVEEPAEKQDVF